MLKGMQLATHYETLIPDLVTLYQCQIDLYQRLNEISAKFLAGPKPGVDYSSLAAEVPEIRAELEQLQNVVFAASALVFMTLVGRQLMRHQSNAEQRPTHRHAVLGS